MNYIFVKNPKTLFLGHFRLFRPCRLHDLFQNQVLPFFILWLSNFMQKKKSGKNTDPILRSCIANRQMGMDRGRQKNRVKFIGPVFLTQIISRQQKKSDATKMEITSAIFKKFYFPKYSIKRCCK